MDTLLLKEMIAQGWVVEQKHPQAPLYIYNYTQAAQYERVWNEVTLACRGLILDEDGNIVARPFPKFFNYGEVENQYIPNESFDVYDKMDGSLGILYWVENEPFIATRGSFQSDQSLMATAMLRGKYAQCIPHLDPSKTYLFEIIYPENRIVINYGDTQALVLLAILDTQTGQDQPLVDIGFPVVKKYDGLNDLDILQTLEKDNHEGFVVKFKSGYRIKIKFAEYVRIHRIVTHVSSVSIWEYLKENKPFEEMLERVPDEFFHWVKKTIAHLKEQFAAVEQAAQQEFKMLETRKETAAYFTTCQHPAILFKMLDGKDYAHIIWKIIRPPFERPFLRIEEVS